MEPAVEQCERCEGEVGSPTQCRREARVRAEIPVRHHKHKSGHHERKREKIHAARLPVRDQFIQGHLVEWLVKMLSTCLKSAGFTKW